jgi:beta-1,2-mannobiose phosphorylase / 1,2-beta-oligomannan phosphorylase
MTLNGAIVRSERNPILTPADFSPDVNAVFNPGACAHDGGTLLLVRVEDRTGISRLVVATSPDGMGDWTVEETRGLTPEPDRFEERWGVEDPRITQIDGTYYVVYTGYSEGGPLVCLATTEDFVTFERHGVIIPPEDKDAALFPETFDGRWALLHRPATATAGLGAHVWLSWSPDLRYWGDGRILLPARRGGWWDANKVGTGPPPLRTDEGWLLCYHGVRVTASGSLYRVGLALLDLDDPCAILRRTDEWVFGPTESYERMGDVPGVVFPTGWVLGEDGDTLRMYYGAADSVVGVATASLVVLLAGLRQGRDA